MGSVSGSIFLFLDYTEVVLHHSLRLKMSLVYLMLGLVQILTSKVKHFYLLSCSSQLLTDWQLLANRTS